MSSITTRDGTRIHYEDWGEGGGSLHGEDDQIVAVRDSAVNTVRIVEGTVEAHELLTAQEAQVARLAAQGHTNPEIGSQPFISPRAAEYHLRKVYTRFGIRSRRALRGAFIERVYTALSDE